MNRKEKKMDFLIALILGLSMGYGTRKAREGEKFEALLSLLVASLAFILLVITDSERAVRLGILSLIMLGVIDLIERYLANQNKSR